MVVPSTVTGALGVVTKVPPMKISMSINYSGGFKEAAQRVVALEKAGLDVVWIAEAYSFDAISQVGYLEIGRAHV